MLSVWLGYSWSKSISDFKDLRKEKDNLENVIKEMNFETKQRELIIESLMEDNSIKADEVEELKKSQEKSRNEASEYKNRYYKLLKLTPETTEDSLGVANDMVDALVGQNKAQEETIEKLDSVVAIQGHIISNLEEVISNKDVIINNKDEIITRQRELITRLEKENKKLRKQKVLNTLRDIGIGIALGALIAIL